MSNFFMKINFMQINQNYIVMSFSKILCARLTNNLQEKKQRLVFVTMPHDLHNSNNDM